MTDPRCNCNWIPGTYSTFSDPTPRYKAHAYSCPANEVPADLENGPHEDDMPADLDHNGN